MVAYRDGVPVGMTRSPSRIKRWEGAGYRLRPLPFRDALAVVATAPAPPPEPAPTLPPTGRELPDDVDWWADK